MKKNKINNSTQKVAAEILRSFVFCTSAEDVKRVSEKIMVKYGLCKDAFTGFPCTPKEYQKSKQRNDAWEKSKKEKLI